MNLKKTICMIIPVVLLIIGFFLLKSNIYDFKTDFEYISENKKPNFFNIKDTSHKKEQFFDYFFPLIVNKNIDVIKKRKEISSSTEFNDDMKKNCTKYKLDCTSENYKTLLLESINIIPASMALAQAANESAWGTSNFAKNGNNYFGIWCFTKGCGIVPNKRGSGKAHEVRKFKNAKESVSFYIDNININPNYSELRKIRLKSHDSLDLIKGLTSYSSRGKKYIDELAEMIEYNQLVEKYDSKMNEYLFN